MRNKYKTTITMVTIFHNITMQFIQFVFIFTNAEHKTVKYKQRWKHPVNSMPQQNLVNVRELTSTIDKNNFVFIIILIYQIIVTFDLLINVLKMSIVQIKKQQK